MGKKLEKIFSRRDRKSRGPLSARAALETCFVQDNWPRAKNVHDINIYKLLLTNWWIGMNETNLTQHGRSTDVNASDVLYLRDKKKTLKKRGNLLRTTSFNGNSCRVRILIKIIMVCVRAALIIKALEYEFKWKYDFLKHF